MLGPHYRKLLAHCAWRLGLLLARPTELGALHLVRRTRYARSLAGARALASRSWLELMKRPRDSKKRGVSVCKSGIVW